MTKLTPQEFNVHYLRGRDLYSTYKNKMSEHAFDVVNAFYCGYADAYEGENQTEQNKNAMYKLDEEEEKDV